MHKHLKECSAIKEKQNKDDAVEPARKRKHEPPLEAQALQTPPETYEDAVRAPKRRRFVHHGLAGDVDAVEVGGTTFYNTAPPPAYVSPHRTWTRPGLDRQASAATGSGHQASATRLRPPGFGHHGLGHHGFGHQLGCGRQRDGLGHKHAGSGHQRPGLGHQRLSDLLMLALRVLECRSAGLRQLRPCGTLPARHALASPVAATLLPNQAQA